MKKILLMMPLMLLALCAGSKAQAQETIQVDCDEAVVARYGFNREILDVLDASKYYAVCSYSDLSFFFTNELPDNAVVLDITLLYDYRNECQVNASYSDESELLSYFRYNYKELQFRYGYQNDLFFTLHGSTHAYLGVRNMDYVSIQSYEYVRRKLQELETNE